MKYDCIVRIVGQLSRGENNLYLMFLRCHCDLNMDFYVQMSGEKCLRKERLKNRLKNSNNRYHIWSDPLVRTIHWSSGQSSQPQLFGLVWFYKGGWSNAMAWKVHRMVLFRVQRLCRDVCFLGIVQWTIHKECQTVCRSISVQDNI